MVTVAWSLRDSGEAELVRAVAGSRRQDYSDLGYPSPLVSTARAHLLPFNRPSLNIDTLTRLCLCIVE